MRISLSAMCLKRPVTSTLMEKGRDAVEDPFAVAGARGWRHWAMLPVAQKKKPMMANMAEAVVGGELDVDVVEMAVPPGEGEGPGDVFGGVSIQVAFDLLGPTPRNGWASTVMAMPVLKRALRWPFESVSPRGWTMAVRGPSPVAA